MCRTINVTIMFFFNRHVTLITYNYFNLSFNCSDAILGISWCRRTIISHTLRTCQMASFQGCSRPALVSWVCLCPGPRASVFSEHASPGFPCCYRFRNMSGSCIRAYRYALFFLRETDYSIMNKSLNWRTSCPVGWGEKHWSHNLLFK